MKSVNECIQLILSMNGVSAPKDRIEHYLKESSKERTLDDIVKSLSSDEVQAQFSCSVSKGVINLSKSEKLKSYPASFIFSTTNTDQSSSAFVGSIVTENGQTSVQVLSLNGEGSPIETVLGEQTKIDVVFFSFISNKRFLDKLSTKVAPRYTWFFRYVLECKKTYGHVMLASAVIGLLAVVGSLFTMNVYDRVVPNNAFNTLWVLAGGVLVVYAFDFLLKMLRGVATDWAGKKIDLSVSSFLFREIMGIQMSQKPASAGVMANHMRDFDSVREFFASLSLLLLIDMPFLGLYLLVIYVIGGPLVFVPLVAIPVVLLFLLIIQRPLRAAVEGAAESTAQKQGLLIESLNGMLDLKLLGAIPIVGRIWDNCTVESAYYANKSRYWSSLGVNFSGFVQQVVQVFLIVGGVYLISDGQLTMGGLIACSILNGRVMAPLGQLVSLVIRMQQAWSSLESLTKVIEKPADRIKGNKYIQPASLKGTIKVEAVDFSYTEEGTSTLQGINLEINPGEKIAIIGRSGGGKSTLLNLLSGIYQPNAGAIYFDGRDLRQIDPSVIRREIVFVPQNPFLMSGTVRENLCLGAFNASDDDILSVAKVSMLDDFVASHPQGYDMNIGEGGCLLSGGQRQSLSIARALLGNGNIILLDEPTSAMDSRTEEEFKTRFKQWSTNKTVIVVTHKLSVLDLVDRVIVVDGKRIASDGPKSRVLKPKPVPIENVSSINVSTASNGNK